MAFGLAIILLSSSVGAQASTCLSTIDRKSGVQTYDDIIRRYQIMMATGQQQLARDVSKQFWNITFVYLRELAADNSLSLAELFSHYFEPFELLMIESHPQDLAKIQAVNRISLEALKRLEGLKPTAKLKPRDHDDILVIINTIVRMGVGLAFYDLLNGQPQVALDPFTAYQRRNIEPLFEGLEDYTLDRVIEAYNNKQNEIREGRNAQAEAAIEENNFQATGESSGPAEDEELQSSENSAAISYEENFALAVRHKLPLRADFTYEYQNARHETMNVSLSEELIEESEGPRKAMVYKMLSALLTGKSGEKGLKTLNIGPDIIEVKAFFRGHWRIIGCLEGRKLRLLEMKDLKDTRGDYSRKIPANYCQ